MTEIKLEDANSVIKFTILHDARDKIIDDLNREIYLLKNMTPTGESPFDMCEMKNIISQHHNQYMGFLKCVEKILNAAGGDEND